MYMYIYACVCQKERVCVCVYVWLWTNMNIYYFYIYYINSISLIDLLYIIIIPSNTWMTDVSNIYCGIIYRWLVKGHDWREKSCEIYGRSFIGKWQSREIRVF